MLDRPTFTSPFWNSIRFSHYKFNIKIEIQKSVKGDFLAIDVLCVHQYQLVVFPESPGYVLLFQ